MSQLCRAASGHERADFIAERLHTGPVEQPDLDEMCQLVGIARIDMSTYCPPEPVLIPGALEAVADLVAAGITVVTVSNVSALDTTPLPPALERLLWGSFRSWELGTRKPDPACWALALDTLRCEPGSAVHIGDDWRCDIVGAQSSGMRAIWVNPHSELPWQTSTVQVVPSLRRGVEIIQGWNDV